MFSTDIQVSFFNLNSVDLDKFEIDKYLTSAEIDKAQNFYRVIDQTNFIKRKVILKNLLSYYLNVDVSEICFQYNCFGKPSLIQTNLHACIKFSVSKSENYVAYAFSSSSEVGIDIEYLNNYFDWKEIAETLFSPDEQRKIYSYRKSYRYFPFFQTWTKREAYTKYLGVGIEDGFKGFDSESLLTKEESLNIVNSSGFHQKFKEFIINDQQLFLVNLYSNIVNPNIIINQYRPQ